MSNTINITKCDNQLILLAVNPSASYEICNIQSGNFNTVDLSVAIEASSDSTFSGTYQPKDGTTGSLKESVTVQLPEGNYSLVYVGLNWGGPYNFEFDFNGKTYDLLNDNSKPLEGAIWSLGNTSIAFDVKAPVSA